MFRITCLGYMTSTSVSRIQFTKMSYSRTSAKGPFPCVSALPHSVMCDLCNSKYIPSDCWSFVEGDIGGGRVGCAQNCNAMFKINTIQYWNHAHPQMPEKYCTLRYQTKNGLKPKHCNPQPPSLNNKSLHFTWITGDVILVPWFSLMFLTSEFKYYFLV